jgi:hypothetical protein
MVIGVVSVNVIGVPVSLTHSVNGSLPICSAVDGADAVAGPGNVTGIGAEQLLPVAVNVAPTMDLPSEDVVQARLYPHWLK